MAGLIGRSRRAKVMLEFWPFGLARAGYVAGRLLDRLGELGFRLSEADEGERCVRRTDPQALLAKYPAADDVFTNLWCVKAPLVPAPDASLSPRSPPASPSQPPGRDRS